jgi:hypothetical protein
MFKYQNNRKVRTAREKNVEFKRISKIEQKIFKNKSDINNVLDNRENKSENC